MDAQYNIGTRYLRIGRRSKALKWYRKAAEQGHADAQCFLAYSYLRGLGVDKDDLQALNWFMKAAEQGHAVAQCNMAGFCRLGVGVAKNESGGGEVVAASSTPG